MSAATRTITLVRKEAGRVEYQFFGAMRVRVEVSSAVDFDPNIFVYRQDMATPYTPDASPTDTFQTVASPADMAEYPIDGPDPFKAFPFFRQKWVELDFRSTLLAEQFWHTVVQEAAVLLHAFNKLEELQIQEVVTIGPFPEDDDDTGNSESMSF
jgi:hypothetical protein